jgi:hypothetical protein
MSSRECGRLRIIHPEKTVGVRNLHRVEEVVMHHQVLSKALPRNPGEGMRRNDESPLPLYTGNGLRHTEARRDALSKEETDYVTGSGRHLLSNDHPKWRSRGECMGSLNRVMICDRHTVNTGDKTTINELIERCRRIEGVGGM